MWTRSTARASLESAAQRSLALPGATRRRRHGLLRPRRSGRGRSCQERRSCSELRALQWRRWGLTGTPSAMPR